MGAVFTPEQRNWRFYADDAAEPTTALAAENTSPTLSSNSDILRLRVTITDIGGKANNNCICVLEYSLNQSDWSAFGDAVWGYANGQATEGGIISGLLLTDSGAQGEYLESGTQAQIMGASASTETDIAIVAGASVAGDTAYYFRVSCDGSPVPLGSGETYPQLTTSSATAPIQATATDGVTLSDTATRTAIYGVAASDGMSASDPTSRVLQIQALLTDIANAGDTALAKAVFVGLASDGATLSDSPIPKTYFQVLSSDGSVFTGQSIGYAVTILGKNPDGTNMLNPDATQALNPGPIGAIAGDGISLTDTDIAILSALATSSDGAIFADTPAITGTYDLSLLDGIRLTDTNAILTVVSALLQDGLNLTDSPLSEMILRGLGQSGVSLSDLLQVSANLNAILSEEVIAADASLAEILGQIVATVTDGTVFSEVLSIIGNLTGSVSDGATLTDSGQTIANFTATAGDSAQFAELVANSLNFISALSDGIKATDGSIGTIQTVVLPNGNVKITFTSAKAQITFTVKKPGVAFTAKKPGITFN